MDFDVLKAKLLNYLALESSTIDRVHTQNNFEDFVNSVRAEIKSEDDFDKFEAYIAKSVTIEPRQQQIASRAFDYIRQQF